MKGGEIQIELKKRSTKNGPQYFLKLIVECDNDVNQISVEWQYDVSWKTNNRKMNCKMTDACDFSGGCISTRLGKTPAGGTKIQIGLIINSWEPFSYPLEEDFPEYYYCDNDEIYDY